VTDITILPALSSAVSEVLERMFFLEALGEAVEPAPEAETVTIQIAFEGDPAGSFQMRVARKAADAIAADFLGEDPETLTCQQRTDVTLELGNMICGSVLSRMESSASFRLGSPRAVEGEEAMRSQPGDTRYTVETGSGTLTVSIRMEERTCPSTPRFAS